MTEICAVIQPFDGDRFDRRYEEVYKPAILNAGFEPYRVDQDDSSNIIIEDIENAIRRSKLCFADITLENANVWYEIGFAFASKKEVCLICEENHENFPFDIRHRKIIKYKTQTPSDFNNLKESITNKLRAMNEKQSKIENIHIDPATSNNCELDYYSINCLALIGADAEGINGRSNYYSLKQSMLNAGLTEIATKLALKQLLSKRMIEMFDSEDYNGNYSEFYEIKSIGWDWLSQNSEKLLLKREISSKINFDDDIPF
jgi:hypothetical protein